MSEQLEEYGEKLPARLISRAIAGWLHAEYYNSSMGLNAYLDKLPAARKALLLPSDDSGNVNARKNDSHRDRLKPWTKGFLLDTTDDYPSARQLFNVLMPLSGNFKRQLYLQSKNQTDYYARKHSDRPLGIDIDARVGHHLLTRFNKQPSPEDFSADIINLDELIVSNYQAFEARADSLEAIRQIGVKALRREASEAVDETLTMQEQYLDLAVDYIIYAAQVREGRLARVPFLEAKSISDEPQVYYPLAA